MGELHAKLGVGSGMWEVTTGCEAGGMEGVWSRRPEGLRDLAGVRGDAPSNISHEYPTGVKGAGGSGGHGRASRHGAERSEAA